MAPERLSLRRQVTYVLGTAVLALCAMCLLPYPRYLRYFEISEDTKPKAPWIYQRIHHDDEPIDIAFFGTSRTDGAIDSRILEDRLLHLTGRRFKAVNFALQRTGRNMHYLLARELLDNRKVRFVFFEIGPLEDRLGHPQFINLADPWEVVLAPFLMNLRYFQDLIRLPGREAYLFLSWIKIKSGLRPNPFETDLYYGSNFDRVDVVPGRTPSQDKNRDRFPSKEELDTAYSVYQARITPSLLPKELDRWEWRMDRHYVWKANALADERGANFALMYLPFYNRYELATHVKRNYLSKVPVIEPPAFVENHHCWLDADHLNAACARRYTVYVAERIAEMMLASGTLREGPS